ncbi:MAG: competence protein TfoX [Clostridia bacterium]|nr:competence protein TfoX [Clostridia bacterium]
MPTSRECALHITEQLHMPGEIRVRAMMGDYVVYYNERVVGGIYDGRLLLKDTPSARRMLPLAERIIPYPGAKEMLLVEDLTDTVHLHAVLEAMLPELPKPRPKKPKQ